MSFKILWTLPYIPWPTTSGGKLRQFELIKNLSKRGHKITLLIQSKSELSASQEKELLKVVDKLIVFPRRNLTHPITLIRSLLAKHPLLVTINGFNKTLSKKFDELIDIEKFDIVQIEHSYGLQPYLDKLLVSGKKFILTEHNFESHMIRATYQNIPSLFKPFIHYDAWRYRKWEKDVLKAPQRLIAVTAEDALKLSEVSKKSVDVVINGVDVEYYKSVKPDIHSKTILFVGNMEYPPNVDAVNQAVTKLMPIIWKYVPDANLRICGYAMPAEWSSKWKDQRLSWGGFVSDIRDEQNKASIFLAPLREGGGSKLKVLEAMAAGLAVVTTYQGASGLKVKTNLDLLIGSSDEELANHVVTLLTRPTLTSNIGNAGRKYVTLNHDWEIAATQLEQIYYTIEDK